MLGDFVLKVTLTQSSGVARARANISSMVNAEVFNANKHNFFYQNYLTECRFVLVHLGDFYVNKLFHWILSQKVSLFLCMN